jgi:predicted amidophosphoribosyltransferase
VSRVGEPGSQRTGCYLCGRPTYDPDKRSRPWARSAAGGRQVLVCPVCQQDRPDWKQGLDRCARCGSTRLSAMLGEVVCRACGTVQAEAVADTEEPNLTGA